MMDSKQFYETYWSNREKKGLLHLSEKDWIPPRIFIASYMFIKEQISSANVVDIGCGEGVLGAVLKKEYIGKLHIIGMDISEKALSYAANNYDKLLTLNIEKESIPEDIIDMQFDFVFCLEVLEHLFEPQKVLEKIRKLLKKDGLLIVSFPNFAFWKNRLDVIKGYYPREYILLHPGEHIQRYTLPSFMKFLKENAFSIIEIEPQIILPRFLKPRTLFLPLARNFPNFFGYQIVIKAKLNSKS